MPTVDEIYYSEDGIADAYIRALDSNLAEVGAFLGVNGISDTNFTRNVNERELLANNRSFKKDSKFQSYSGDAQIVAKRMDMMKFYLAGTMTVDGNVSEFVEDPDGLPDRFALYVVYPLDGENGENGMGYTHYANCRSSNLQTPRQTGQYSVNTLSIDALVGAAGYARKFVYDLDAIGLNTTGVTTAPTISSSTPANSATDVAQAAALNVVFAISMNESSLSEIKLYRLSTGLEVAGVITYAETGDPVDTFTATFTPDASMAASEEYALVIPGSVRSAVGNKKGTPTVITFTTAA